MKMFANIIGMIFSVLIALLAVTVQFALAIAMIVIAWWVITEVL